MPIILYELNQRIMKKLLLVMPYGLASVPSIFQSMINYMLRDYLNKFAIAYIDDILIYLAELFSHVKRMFGTSETPTISTVR